MKKWNLLKQDIVKYNELSKNNDNWRYRFLNIKNNFDKIPISELKKISENYDLPINFIFDRKVR